MKKTLFLLLSSFIATSLFAYSDSDMDGVANNVDKCPNTPLTDLVDINGCSIKTVTVKQKTKSHADVILGINYSDFNFNKSNESDTYSSSIQADYYYGNFSLQASTSYYYTTTKGSSDDNGLNDSFIGAAYNFRPIKNLSLRLGVGALLPTYKASNNNTDYTGSTSLSYSISKINIFGGYSYTLVNDNDTNLTTYQNTNAYSAGLGYYFTNKLYMSASYNLSNSVYKGDDDIQSASLYGYYSVNNNVFLMFSYAYGISDTASDNAASLKVGYYF